MTPQEGRAVLTRSGWLAAVPEDFRLAVLDAATWRWYENGQTIIDGGQPVGALVGVASGTVSLTFALGAPDAPIAHIASAGHWFGYRPLISANETSIATVAKSRVLVARIAQSTVEMMLAANPGWWRYLALLVVEQGTIAASIVADLLMRESRRRCAAALLRIVDQRFSHDAGATNARISQSELASLANLSRNTTHIILADFEAQGLVSRSYNSIDLLDPTALRAIVDDDFIAAAGLGRAVPSYA